MPGPAQGIGRIGERDGQPDGGPAPAQLGLQRGPAMGSGIARHEQVRLRFVQVGEDLVVAGHLLTKREHGRRRVPGPRPGADLGVRLAIRLRVGPTVRSRVRPAARPRVGLRVRPRVGPLFGPNVGSGIGAGGGDGNGDDPVRQRPAGDLGQIGQGAQRHRVGAIQDELQQPAPGGLLCLGGVRPHLAVARVGHGGQVVHVAEQRVRERGHDSGGELGAMAHRHDPLPGSLRTDPVGGLQRVQAAALFRLVFPEHERHLVPAGRRGGGVGNEAHEGGQDLLYARAHDLAVWPVNGTGELRDLLAELRDDLVGQAGQLGTEDVGERRRQHGGVFVPTLVGGPRHRRWLRPRRVAAARVTWHISDVRPGRRASQP